MIVNLRFTHDNPIHAADALRRRDVSEDVKKFTYMFAAGHSPASALDVHKTDLDFIFTSADRALVPDMQWCYR